MFHAEGDDVDLASGSRDRLLFAPAKFRYVAKLCPAKQITRARRRDHFRGAIESPQCAHIEVIEMRVRQQDDVDCRQLVEFERGRRQSFRSDRESGQSNTDSEKKNGVGQNSNAEKIDEHGGVTEPGRSHARVIPLRRVWLGKGRSNRPPALTYSFAPQISYPAAHARTSVARLDGGLLHRTPLIPNRLIPARESMPSFP